MYIFFNEQAKLFSAGISAKLQITKFVPKVLISLVEGRKDADKPPVSSSSLCLGP